MEQDHPGEAVEVLEEELAEVLGVEAGLEATVPEPGEVETASAPVAERLCPIRLALRATT